MWWRVFPSSFSALHSSLAKARYQEWKGKKWITLYKWTVRAYFWGRGYALPYDKCCVDFVCLLYFVSSWGLTRLPTTFESILFSPPRTGLQSITLLRKQGFMSHTSFVGSTLLMLRFLNNTFCQGWLSSRGMSKMPILLNKKNGRLSQFFPQVGWSKEACPKHWTGEKSKSPNLETQLVARSSHPEYSDISQISQNCSNVWGGVKQDSSGLASILGWVISGCVN